MAEPRRDHSAIEIEIAAADDEASNNSSSKPCIFEVPRKFKERNPKSYIPESFSIGPLHYGKEHLRATEKIKKHYLNNLLKPTPHTTLEEFKKSILELEGRARECYAFPTDHLDKDQFIDMLVLDGCFIIELLRNNHKYSNNIIDDDDPVFSVCWVLQDLYHDLILLENQVPWFVLECLFDMTSQKIPDSKPLTQLALDFFCIIFSENALPSIPDGVKINHILDLIRNALVSSSRTRQESSGYCWQQIPSATSLKESGVVFERTNCSNLLDIKFTDGVLEIPSLLIQEATCEAFRNLVSYEQCYPNCETKITSYAVLLNNLLSTADDINLLCKDGIIINNWFNPNDTLEFFKNISTDTCVKEFYHAQFCEQVVQFSHRLWPRFRALYLSQTMRLYRDPIACLSVYAFYITLLQIVYTILQYQKDNPPH